MEVRGGAVDLCGGRHYGCVHSTARAVLCALCSVQVSRGQTHMPRGCPDTGSCTGTDGCSSARSNVSSRTASLSFYSASAFPLTPSPRALIPSPPQTPHTHHPRAP